ncbi:MAG: hypothetical protein KBC43_10975 [Bacteroidales bacterium]|nr:hypothetical protein [Bacteroidales bacterium]
MKVNIIKALPTAKYRYIALLLLLIIFGCGKEESPEEIEKYFFPEGSINNYSDYYSIADNMKSQSFFDDFANNKNGWYEGSSDIYSFQIKDGAYFISSINQMYGTYQPKISLSENYEIEIEMIIPEDNSGNIRIGGIIWGRTLADKYNAFGISSNAVFHSFNSEDYDNESPVYGIIKGVNEPNKLIVRKCDDKYYFYINKNLVNTMKYIDTKGTDHGIYIENHSSIEVTYIKVYQLNLN